MTKQQFDNYKFSAKTEVKVLGIWMKIMSVNFGRRRVGLLSNDGLSAYFKNIEDIRN